MLVKYYAIDQKTFHPGVFDRLYDVLNFLIDNFAQEDRVLCLDKETFPHLVHSVPQWKLDMVGLFVGCAVFGTECETQMVH